MIQAALRKKCLASLPCVLQEKNHLFATKTFSGHLFEKKYTLLHTQFSNLSRNRRVFVQTALRAFILEK